MTTRTVTLYFRGFMRSATETLVAPADFYHPADYDVEYGEIEVDEGMLGDAEDYLREISGREGIWPDLDEPTIQRILAGGSIPIAVREIIEREWAF